MTQQADPATIGSSLPAREPDMDNSHLLDTLREGLPLTRRPFEVIGKICGASEDEVLERLRRLHGNGTLTDLAPLPSAHAGKAGAPAPDSSDGRLLEVVSRGFPLLPRPYEAIAAVLGTSEAAVLDRLHELVEAGRIGRISAHSRTADDDYGAD